MKLATTMISHKIHYFIAIFLLFSIGIFHINASFDSEMDLVFRLYTREFPNYFLRIYPTDSHSISGSSFNPNRTTVIFIHGYMSREKTIIGYRDAYLKLGDYNFIGVDWISGAATINYLAAKRRFPLVSRNDNDLKIIELNVN